MTDELVGILKTNGDREYKADGVHVLLRRNGALDVAYVSGGHSVEGSGADVLIDGKKVRWEVQEPVRHGTSASRRGTPAIDLRNEAQDERIRKYREQAKAIDGECDQKSRHLWRLVASVGVAVAAGAGFLLWMRGCF
jgi:hypothetical protein